MSRRTLPESPRRAGRRPRRRSVVDHQGADLVVAQAVSAVLAAVAAAAEPNPTALGNTVLEAAALALDCPLGVLLVEGRVLAAIGFGTPSPQPHLVARLGELALAAPVGTSGQLLLARPDHDYRVADRVAVQLIANLTTTLTSTLISAPATTLSDPAALPAVTADDKLAAESRPIGWERLSRIHRAIIVGTPLPDLADAIAATAADLLEAEVAILRIGGSDLISVHGVDLDTRSARARLLRDEIGTLGEAALRLGSPLRDNTFTAQPEAGRYGMPYLQAALAVPVRDGDLGIGYLLLGSRRPERHFTELDEAAATTLAELAAVAVQHARTNALLNAGTETSGVPSGQDSLTGLPNRGRFLAALAAAGLSGAPLNGGQQPCLLALDLDYFALVNDTYGQVIGDQVLTVVASRLQAAVRPSDLVARTGGDDFAVLLAGVPDAGEAQRLAERLHATATQAVRLEQNTFYPSVSVGVAVGATGEPAEALLGRADQALREAKRRGRGRVTMYHDGLAAVTIPEQRADRVTPRH